MNDKLHELRESILELTKYITKIQIMMYPKSQDDIVARVYEILLQRAENKKQEVADELILLYHAELVDKINRELKNV